MYLSPGPVIYRDLQFHELPAARGLYPDIPSNRGFHVSLYPPLVPIAALSTKNTLQCLNTDLQTYTQIPELPLQPRQRAPRAALSAGRVKAVDLGFGHQCGLFF